MLTGSNVAEDPAQEGAGGDEAPRAVPLEHETAPLRSFSSGRQQ
jgi:hypothetical protein